MKTLVHESIPSLAEARLLVVGGGDHFLASEVPLNTLPLRIGRMRGCHVVLAHPLVSREHCEIFELDGGLFVRDLGSTNGTFVGRERIDTSPLCPGDLLTVGVVTFRAVYGDYGQDELVAPPSEGVDSCSVLETQPMAKSAGDTTQISHGRRITHNASRYRARTRRSSMPKRS